jgi:mRNA interferase MazF
VKRGDIVVAVARGEYRKSRPVVIVQSDLFIATHSSVLVCLLSTELIAAPLFRPTVSPSSANGLCEVWQTMTDKLLALPRDLIRERIGAVDDETLLALNRALALMLGLARA